jgi:FtsP/CotA-like multicopper oxidase with cupredoxin domain
MAFNRRDFLTGTAALAGWSTLPAGLVSAQEASHSSKAMTLRAGYVNQAVTSGGRPVNFWGFNDTVPGPILRYRKGDALNLVVQNDLTVDTAVHWHGVRVPNAMDGVPGVTQHPIKPGATFRYQFPVSDSGTFWYHPHQMSFEQVPRGLYGALIVEEAKPIEVDRELVWLFSDVKVDPNSQQVEDFGRVLDIANDGRLGNQVLLNGRAAGAAHEISVRAGERLRLRLINAASARIFRLSLPGHVLNVVAHDGQAITPYTASEIDLGAGMRVDLVVDCLQAPGSRVVLGNSDRRSRGPLATLVYRDEAPLRAKALGAPMQVQANALPEPDLKKATDHYIVFQGGMRGSPVIGLVDGKPAKIHEIMEKEKLAWTMNFSAQHEHALMHDPLLYLDKGEHVLLRMINETDFAHPMHLHGHFFRVIAINGQANPRREWRDTVLMGPRESVDVAFVADNPGEWMFHCHILDHAAGGMMGTIAVG